METPMLKFQLPLLLCALSLPACGQMDVGLVGGITRDSASGKPLAEAKIIAHNVDRSTDHSTLSNADGVLTFTNLEPGRYEVAATKDGFQKSFAQVEVAARRTARVDLPLQSSNAPLTEREKLLLDRLERVERRLAAMEMGPTEKKNV